MGKSKGSGSGSARARGGLSCVLVAGVVLGAWGVWVPAARADFGDMATKHWQCADNKHFDQDKDKRQEIQNWNCLIYDEKGPPGYLRPEISLEWCKHRTRRVSPLTGALGKEYWAYEGCRVESGSYSLKKPDGQTKTGTWPKQQTEGYHFHSQTSLKPKGIVAHCMAGVYTLRNQMTVRVIHHTFDINGIIEYGTVSFDHTEKITLKGCP
ncbi:MULTISPECIES: hypothetical protein [Actinomadura]|uniref:Uncharacterized protein n=1 Tax=Actinomadura yumaensis TaxID=111807 RepID=A0ABW2CDM3_9ACTN|nr:hypothetical protein [Actinomadura sp. J1-007]MWK35630.1 hypothetical protein [Actinomadura sp. J1-007]